MIELGAGDGTDARHLAEHGFGVLAVDYVYPPSPSDAVVRLPDAGVLRLNRDLTDGRTLVGLAVAALRAGRGIHVHSRLLLEQLDSPSRRALLELVCRLPPGSTMTAAVRIADVTMPAGPDPTLAALSRRTLDVDAAHAGLSWETVLEEPNAGQGRTVLITMRRTDVAPRAIDRLRRAPRDLRELKAELAHWRRMPVRLAELQDVVDSQLLASGPSGSDDAHAKQPGAPEASAG